ncbi:hypothetical protein HZB01_05030 [Candidatus Woesearchaeota archaeon]|nr:hypothetical protein [Candidatus Woesearchaeota archaeon]
MKQQIIASVPVSMATVKANLETIKARDKELNFRATKTEEYLASFVTLTEKKATELYKKIEELNVPRLKDAHIVKIVDILPTTPEQLKAVLQGYTLTVSNDNIKKIVGTVKEFI